MNLQAKKSIAVAFFSIVFLNSFVDLGHKVIIQSILYNGLSPHDFVLYSSFLNGIFLLPYILLFTPSGFCADRFAKAKVLRLTAWLALPIFALIVWAYYQGHFKLAFALTFMLAIQSTFNSPAKYGYIKEYFATEKIAEANAIMQVMVTLGILLASVLFSLPFNFIHGLAHLSLNETLRAVAWCSWIFLALATLEAILTHFLLASPPASQTRFNWAHYAQGRYLATNLKTVASNRVILYCILALGVFWGINQVVIANYPAYLKETVHAGVTFSQSVFGFAVVGIVLGSIAAGRISRRYIETGTLPLASLLLSILLGCLVLLKTEWSVGVVIFAYGFASGLLLVPLNALLQFNAKNENLGRILAANNFIQFLFMLGFLALSALITFLQVRIQGVFILLALLGFVGTCFAFKLVPQAFVRYIVGLFFQRFYRVKVLGITHLPASGGVLLLGNHASFLDWAIIQIASPRPVRFVIDKPIYESKWFNWIFKRINAIPLSPVSVRGGLEKIKEALQKGEVVALFPEGHLSRNGQLGQFFKGYEKAVADTDAAIVPFYIHGLWGSIASRASTKYRKLTRAPLRFRRVTFSFGPALPAPTKAHEVKQAVMELAHQVWDEQIQKKDHLASAWLYRAKRQKGKTTVIDGMTDQTFSGYRLITAVLCLQSRLKTKLAGADNVGIFLPSSVGGLLTNLSLVNLGRPLINLNYTASVEALQHMVRAAKITHVVTSQQFCQRLTARGIDVAALKSAIPHWIELETVKEEIGGFSRFTRSLAAWLLPYTLLHFMFVKKRRAEDLAVLLFSSGSEGLPKGVMLSHKNILSNLKQMSCVLNVQHEDGVLSCLPLFHAFGLTVTTFMPLIEGTKMILMPDPTDVARIARVIARYEATILCGTSTFLNFYLKSKKINPLMLRSLRLVIAGAERLAAPVKQGFNAAFHVDILEGYGATETSPVASTNLPDLLVKGDGFVQVGTKAGTVGLPLPGTLFKIVDPITQAELACNEAGLILISGPQVMLGYWENPAKTEEVLIELDGKKWYRTGDKGSIDEDGFLTIIDRYSRFAKIAGEMVSLSAIEQALLPYLSQGIEMMAVNIPDARKGEQVVVLLESLDENVKSQLIAEMRKHLPPLMQASEILGVESLPRLGSGKADFAAAKHLVLRLIQIDNA